MGNIIFGVIMMIGGFSGTLALRGTNSGGALGVLGIGLFLYGLYQVKSRASSEG